MDPCQQGQVGRGAHESHHAGFGWDRVVAKRWAEGEGLYSSLSPAPLKDSGSTIFPAAFWYPSFYLHAYNGTLLTLTPGLVQMPPDPCCLPTFPPTRPSCMGIP